MSIIINSYFADTNEHAHTMRKSVVDYTTWVERAIGREYKIARMGNKILLFGGRGKRYFIVEEEQQ